MANNNTQQSKHFSNQYLNQYAEIESSTISKIPHEIRKNIKAKNTLIIPAYNEAPEFLSRLKKHPVKNCFFILVNNSPDNKNNGDHKNNILHNFTQESGEILWELDNVKLIRWPNENFLISVDRFSKQKKIPAKQGVGLARKIACDIAIKLIQDELLDSKFIHSTDADATLPENYFLQTNELLNSRNISAATYNYSHSKEISDIAEATDIYEQSMRYYVDGLHWAKSRFAFHTIGSCLAISAEHYCMARGFPKKSGGEDFYLLNKLAKLGEINSLEGDPILISSRESDRVPFGTGPAVSKIIASEKRLNYPVYSPEIFVELKKLLNQFEELIFITDYTKDGSSESQSVLQSTLNRCEQWLFSLSPRSREALLSLNIESLFTHLISQCKKHQQKREHITYWFDGFKTLKYIHFLQQHQHPAIPLRQALITSKALGF
ncbi:MAG: hypothetical protein K6L75_08865 [Cellvibrionaceae bacterium]